MYKQRKIIKGLLLSVVLACFTSAAFAKVAVFDFNKILKNSPLAQAANKRLKKQFAEREKTIIQLRKKVREKENKLSSDGVTMTRDKIRKIELNIRKDKRKIKRLQEDLREDVTIRRNSELRKLHAKVKKAVASVAKKGKYTLVLVSNGVFYYDQTVDITKKVIAEMK